ncbi:MAG: O-antigen ligase family protein [Rubrobacteraceae bacterium]|nr:O-antigen ligase family protein [Rubrobacteraceae bacterium]
MVYVFTRDKLLLLLVVLALLSIFWSDARTITLEQGVALVGTTLIGGYLAMSCSLTEQLKLLAVALGITAVLSLAFGLALPSYGISHSASTSGNWQGIFNHKNALGRAMALGLVVFSIRAISVDRYRWLAWSGVGLAGALLLLANSITGLVVALLVLALLPLYRALRWRHTIALPLVIVAALLFGGLAVLVASDAGTILGLVDRDVTFTGRTVVWSAVLDSIRERPWLGYGYNAFWLGWEGPSAQVWLATGTTFVGAQSGILDLWLELGLIGLVVFVTQASRSFLRSMTWARFTNTAEGLWPLAFLTFFLLYNASETLILEQNNLYWILYVATVLSVSIQPTRYRGRATSDGTRAVHSRHLRKASALNQRVQQR